MKKKVTFVGFQCDVCGELLPPDCRPHKFKVKMSGPEGCYMKDKMCLCETCALLLHDAIIMWYSDKDSAREKNTEKIKAMLAEAKE